MNAPKQSTVTLKKYNSKMGDYSGTYDSRLASRPSYSSSIYQFFTQLILRLGLNLVPLASSENVESDPPSPKNPLAKTIVLRKISSKEVK